MRWAALGKLGNQTCITLIRHGCNHDRPRDLHGSDLSNVNEARERRVTCEVLLSCVKAA